MNAELDDLMLEYLLRKKLGQDITKYKTQEKPVAATSAPKTMRRILPRHIWSRSDYEKVALMFQQGYKTSQIAREMNLRTMQVEGAVEGMKGKNLKSAAPRLLLGAR